MDKAKLYEGMFLIDANLAAKDWSAIETHIHEILKKNRAELIYSEKWPERKLAYDIKGAKKGTYYLTYFNAPGEAIREIENDSRLSERILRLLIIQERGLGRANRPHLPRSPGREHRKRSLLPGGSRRWLAPKIGSGG